MSDLYQFWLSSCKHYTCIAGRNRKLCNLASDGLLSYDFSDSCLALGLHLFNTNITMRHNSYMILQMMLWISFCWDFFVTKLTMMSNAFIKLKVMLWICICLLICHKVHNYEERLHDLKNDDLYENLFGFFRRELYNDVECFMISIMLI